MTKKPTDVIYRVDAAGYLTFVNEGWNAFAVLNDTPELLGPAVLGRRLFDALVPQLTHGMCPDCHQQVLRDAPG